MKLWRYGNRREADPASRLARHMLLVGSVWLALLVSFQIFFGEITAALSPFFAAPLWLLLLLAGGCVAVGGLFGAWAWRERWRQALLIAAAMPAAYLLSTPLASAALYLRFLMDKPGYDRVVAELEAEPGIADEAWRRENARRIRIDDGPPRRIAFVTWKGIPDPWGAVVHDPSHALASVKGLRPRMFNSSVVECGPLGGAYYRCSFS